MQIFLDIGIWIADCLQLAFVRFLFKFDWNAKQNGLSVKHRAFCSKSKHWIRLSLLFAVVCKVMLFAANQLAREEHSSFHSSIIPI